MHIILSISNIRLDAYCTLHILQTSILHYYANKLYSEYQTQRLNARQGIIYFQVLPSHKIKLALQLD